MFEFFLVQTSKNLNYFFFLTGVAHISHETFVANHTRRLAEKLFSTENEAILVADATYVYIEKSSNYKFQRMSYSTHKSRPLVKPMVLVSTTGYILDVFGPYYANGQNNDSFILKHMLVSKRKKIFVINRFSFIQ